MELAIGALELQNSLYFSLFAGNCVGDRFAGDCFHHHPCPYGLPVLVCPVWNTQETSALHVSEDLTCELFWEWYWAAC